MQKEEGLMEKITSLAKRRGFIFPGSEIYGGLSGTYDYGPLGVALKNNIKNLWWRMFVDSRDDVYGVDAAILMNSKAWEASGHVSGFSDPAVQCGTCLEKYRIDHIPGFSQLDYETVKKEFRIKFSERIEVFINAFSNRNDEAKEKLNKYDVIVGFIKTESLSEDQKNAFDALSRQILDEAAKSISEGKKFSIIIEGLQKILDESENYTGYVAQQYLKRFVKCPNCASKDWVLPAMFNMMFKTHAGANENSASVVYLRPETAGGIFVNFKNIIDTFHPKLPFGIAQIGKAFRNEIAPRDFVFRSREFEQMELEYFVNADSWEGAFEEWREGMVRFAEACGLSMNAFHSKDIEVGDLAHYSKKTIDFEFDFPFGRGELWGLAYRGDFDLSAHEKGSTVELKYSDGDGVKVTPHVIEPSLGVDRTVLAVLSSVYREEVTGDDTRVYLAFPSHIAPIKAAVFPLLKNKPELVVKAREVYSELKKRVPQIMFDDNGNIGKRYRRQDEIGTPWCITIDFDTLGENPEHKDTVTVRNRDTGSQERMAISEVIEKVAESASLYLQ